MKSYIAAAAIAVGLSGPAFADEQVQPNQSRTDEPVLMTEAELDGVVGGQCEALVGCIDITLQNTQVGVEAVVAVAANVLTSDSSAVARGQSGGVQQNGRGIVFNPN